MLDVLHPERLHGLVAHGGAGHGRFAGGTEDIATLGVVGWPAIDAKLNKMNCKILGYVKAWKTHKHNTLNDFMPIDNKYQFPSSA